MISDVSSDSYHGNQRQDGLSFCWLEQLSDNSFVGCAEYKNLHAGTKKGLPGTRIFFLTSIDIINLWLKT